MQHTSGANILGSSSVVGPDQWEMFGLKSVTPTMYEHGSRGRRGEGVPPLDWSAPPPGRYVLLLHRYVVDFDVR